MDTDNRIDTLDESIKSDMSLNVTKAQEKADKIRNLIDAIRINQPVSLWDLEKITNTPHSTLFYILRDLEFSGAVWSRIKINDSNRAVRIFYTSKIKKEAEVSSPALNSTNKSENTLCEPSTHKPNVRYLKGLENKK